MSNLARGDLHKICYDTDQVNIGIRKNPNDIHKNYQETESAPKLSTCLAGRFLRNTYALKGSTSALPSPVGTFGFFIPSEQVPQCGRHARTGTEAAHKINPAPDTKVDLATKLQGESESKPNQSCNTQIRGCSGLVKNHSDSATNSTGLKLQLVKIHAR